MKLRAEPDSSFFKSRTAGLGNKIKTGEEE